MGHVPNFYLQRWAKNEKLIVVDRDDPAKRYPAAVKDASVERYFYALPTESGWDMTMEKTLSKLESIAAVDIGKVLEGRSTTLPAFRTRLSFFMAVQLVRGRAPRQAMIDFYKDIFLKTAQLSTPEIIQAQVERRGEPMTIEAARERAHEICGASDQDYCGTRRVVPVSRGRRRWFSEGVDVVVAQRDEAIDDSVSVAGDGAKEAVRGGDQPPCLAQRGRLGVGTQVVTERGMLGQQGGGADG